MSCTSYKLKIRSINHLARLLGISKEYLFNITEKTNELYDPFEVEKKNGGTRKIEPPKKELKIVQNKILQLFDDRCLPDNIHSYRKGRSIKTNTICHVGNNYLLKIDIKDFYPYITNKKIYESFCNLDCSPDVSAILTKLTTKDGHLPQGAPTSPFLANLQISKIAQRINRIGESMGFVVTYYGDDIAISGTKRIRKFKNLFIKILCQEGFNASLEKTIFYSPNDEKIITGITVGNRNIYKPDSYMHDLKLRISEQQIPFTTEEERSIRGKIGHIYSINIGQGNKMYELLNRKSQELKMKSRKQELINENLSSSIV